MYDELTKTYLEKGREFATLTKRNKTGAAKSAVAVADVANASVIFWGKRMVALHAVVVAIGVATKTLLSSQREGFTTLIANVIENFAQRCNEGITILETVLKEEPVRAAFEDALGAIGEANAFEQEFVKVLNKYKTDREENLRTAFLENRKVLKEEAAAVFGVSELVASALLDDLLDYPTTEVTRDKWEDQTESLLEDWTVFAYPDEVRFEQGEKSIRVKMPYPKSFLK